MLNIIFIQKCKRTRIAEILVKRRIKLKEPQYSILQKQQITLSFKHGTIHWGLSWTTWWQIEYTRPPLSWNSHPSTLTGTDAYSVRGFAASAFRAHSSIQGLTWNLVSRHENPCIIASNQGSYFTAKERQECVCDHEICLLYHILYHREKLAS